MLCHGGWLYKFTGRGRGPLHKRYFWLNIGNGKVLCAPSHQIKYSGTSPLRTLLYLNFSPYYRGFLNSEVILYTPVLYWDTEWCPDYRGFHISEVCNREIPLYLTDVCIWLQCAYMRAHTCYNMHRVTII